MSGPDELFPPLHGEPGEGTFYSFFSPIRVPWMLIAIWLLLTILLLVGVRPPTPN